MSFSITSGIKKKAQKVVVYGVEGIGKTTFAAQFPSPIFIDTEGSTEFLDVKRFEKPQSWTMLLDEVKHVRDNPGLCATLVIDTLDWAERICIASVCAKQGIGGIEDMAYGRGYTYAYEEFGKLLNALSDVAARGVNVVCVAHAMIKKFEQPDEAEPYDRYQLKLVDTPKKSNAGMVKEWADAVLFANYETIVETVGEGKGAKGKARGGQKRVLHTQHHACWDAKNRWGLPPEIPLDYAQIAAFVPTAAPNPTLQAAPTPAASAPIPVVPAQPVQISAPRQECPAAPKPVQSVTFAQDGTVVSDTAKAAASGLPGFWAPALQLMEKDGVTIDDIVANAVYRKHFTPDTPPSRYPKDYVEGAIVTQWPKVVENVRNLREKNEPVPFGAPDMTKA